MFDGIKIQDVSVDVETLLTNDRLTFGSLVDTQTGFILNHVRTAYDRGLTFRLVPRRTGQGYRLEMKGSLHKFHNNGQHNADQFSINGLLLTLDELVCSFGFDPFQSRINNIEFGVNVELPFPVSQILKNLVCYRNQPFYLDTKSGTPYYACKLQRYTVKIYDKGKQKGLNYHLLRFEIRVSKMEYFNGTGIQLRTLADLINLANYPVLGALLVETFNEILFDDPTINSTTLSPDERNIYTKGINSRYWQIPDDLTPEQATTHRQRLSRDRRRYRALFDQYGGHWQRETVALIDRTWAKLTTTDDHLLTRIDSHKRTWYNLTTSERLSRNEEVIYCESTVKNGEEECHKLTDNKPTTCHELTDCSLETEPDPSNALCHKLTGSSSSDLSQINPLYSGLDCDSNQPSECIVEQPSQPQQPGAVVCPITGIVIDHPRPRQRFASAALLQTLYHTDRRTFDRVAARFLTVKQAEANLDQQCYSIAHNIRNAYTNQFNNPLRRIKKYQRNIEGQLPLLFPICITQLTDRIQAGIEYRKGTGYEINL
jgi:hypothetical protein